MRAAPLLAIVFLAAVLGLLVAASAPARAGTDANLYGYTTSDGGFTPLSDGGSMPLGATVEVHVWADLYSCDPVTVYWGDGTHDTMNFGGSFSETFTHVYASEGTYTIYALDCAGTGGNTATITVGGLGGSLFDPSSPMFLPTFFGLILGVMALGMSLGTPRTAPRGKTGGAATAAQAWQPAPTFQPGIPPSMASHLVSYRDIPVGAPRQNPQIPMRAGEPTDVFADPHCPACGGPLGYVAGGWFCLNPACPLREPKDDPFPRFVHGL